MVTTPMGISDKARSRGFRAKRATARSSRRPLLIARFDPHQNGSAESAPRDGSRGDHARGLYFEAQCGAGHPVFVRRLALAIALIAGLLGSQGPEFAQQYRQRIGGALEELNRIVAEFEAESAREHVTPSQAIGRLEQNDDPLVRERGEDMAQTIKRTERLQEQFDAMRSAGPLKRLYVLAKDFDPEIAQHTLDNYEPAAPTSFEALAAAGLGGVSAWAATRLFAWPIRRLLGGAGGRASIRSERL